MKKILTVTMFAIVLATTVSGCGTLRNWFHRGDDCDPCGRGGAFGAGPIYGGAAGYAPAGPAALPGPAVQYEVLPQR